MVKRLAARITTPFTDNEAVAAVVPRAVGVMVQVMEVVEPELHEPGVKVVAPADN